MPRAVLRTRVDAERAHWTVRLEDVAPDGRATLVTGALFNGAMRRSRTEPAPLVPGEWFDAEIPLHFTTWTFPRGHRIRLSVANAQFPMAWPSPTLLVSGLATNDPRTRLELPVVPDEFGRPVDLPPPEPREARSDARAIELPGVPTVQAFDPLTGMRGPRFDSRYGFEIRDTRVTVHERHRYGVVPADPSRASYLGEETHEIVRPGRRLRLDTAIDITSTRDSLQVRVERRLTENGREVRKRTWRETIARGIH
jgi:hypothetical protein